MRIVSALSGGMDSTTVLARLLADGHEVHCLNFTYGSKHNQYECMSAEAVADYYDVSYKLIDLSNIFENFQSNLLKSGGEIPEGHYEQENMKLTVVPGRNTIFSGILMGYAQSIGASAIALGVHQGDHEIYPDCRIEYINSLRTTICLATEGEVDIYTPYLHTNKIGIIKDGLKLNVPYHLTRTCYKDQEISCGVCGSCRERIEGFQENGVKDPIPYETEIDW